MLNLNNRLLPYSILGYAITVYGTVLDCSGKLIEQVVENETSFVELDWIWGTKKYPVGLLVLCSFGKLDLLPVKYLDTVEVLYKDSDHNNLTLSNLLYRFKNGPIECEGVPNHYHIPMFTNYVINKAGEIFSLVKKRYMKYSIQSYGKGNPNNRKGGYHNYSLLVGGSPKLISKHRALAFTFLEYDNTVTKMTVNHIDGNSQNNDLSNLEWATYRENNLHAIRNMLRMKRTRAVLVKNLKDGSITRYYSISNCSQSLGYQHTGLVRHRLDSVIAINKLFPDYLQFKYDDGKEFPEIDIMSTKISRNGDDDVMARNVFTGEVFVFNGTTQAAEYTKVDSRAIARHLRESRAIPILGWNFAYKDSFVKWPEHSARHLEMYREYPLHPRYGVIAVKENSEIEEIFFTSVRNASIKFGVPMEKVHSCLLNKKPLEGYLLKYFKLEENLGQPTE